jgi:pimeloyl-ACP methyl ester carboxylesterase
MTSEVTQEVLYPHPDLPLTVARFGAGKPVLVLHGGHGPEAATPYVDHLAASSRILLPTHPGWPGTERPEWFSGFDDLAITYLDVLADERISDVTVIALSFGAWIAAEMAIRDRGRQIGRLVIVGGLGPEIPEYPVHVMDPVPENVPMDVVYSYAGQSLGDPKMLRRLRRVEIPTLVVWGEHDAVQPPEYGRKYANGFPHAQFQMIKGAGHRPALKDPKTTFDVIDAFLKNA